MIRLFELRNEKGLSQRDIAKIFNISQGTYNNWENSKTEPSIDQLISLANFFNVTVDYLIGNDNSNSFLTLSKDQNTLLTLYDNLSEKTQKALLSFIKNM